MVSVAVLIVSFIHFIIIYRASTVQCMSIPKPYRPAQMAQWLNEIDVLFPAVKKKVY